MTSAAVADADEDLANIELHRDTLEALRRAIAAGDRVIRRGPVDEHSTRSRSFEAVRLL